MKLKSISILLIMFIALSAKVQAQDSIKSFTLKECIAYGLSNHPSVKIQANNIKKAHQTARKALSAYLPQISANANVTYNIKRQQTVIPEGTFGPGTPEQRVAFGTPYNSAMTVQLNQKIYDQSLLFGIKASQPNKQLAKLNQEQNNEDIIYNTAVAYYQILVAQKQLSLLKANKTHFAEILRTTKLREQQGVAKKVDIKQVQVNLNNVNAQISTVKSNLQIAMNTLKNNMGLPMKDSVILTDTSHWLNAQPDIQPYPQFNYTNTINGRMQRTQIELYHIQKQNIKAQALPSVSLFARYGANGFGSDLGETFSPLLDYSAIGIQLSWNIFTGFQRDAQYREAILDVKNARLNYRLNGNLLNLQYQNAESKSNEARATIITNKQNMALAADVYDNTTLQYRQGLASLTDLLNAELSYKQAQTNYINSLLNYYIADLAVKKANGHLIDYYHQL